MNVSPSCPRCGGSVSTAGPSSTAWHCNLHGAVFPLRTAYRPDRDGLRALVRHAAVPAWLADMLLISEEPGVGLGARFAGIAGPDPGQGFATGTPHAFVRFGHHEFPLWHVAAPDLAAFAGEVLGNWLWIVLWPDTAGVLMIEALSLRDLRDPGQDLDLPFGP